MTDRDPDIIVVTTSKEAGRICAERLGDMGKTVIVVDRPNVGTVGHIDQIIPPEIVVLINPREHFDPPVVLSDNPHRAKKLKGRNRRKW
jgi:hypothetical protein